MIYLHGSDARQHQIDARSASWPGKSYRSAACGSWPGRQEAIGHATGTEPEASLVKINGQGQEMRSGLLVASCCRCLAPRAGLEPAAYCLGGKPEPGQVTLNVALCGTDLRRKWPDDAWRRPTPVGVGSHFGSQRQDGAGPRHRNVVTREAAASGQKLKALSRDSGPARGDPARSRLCSTPRLR